MLDEASDVKTILVVTAHPDDVDFGAAGSVATWTDKGIDVRYCVVTDGDAGGFDPAVPRSEIPRIRREEQTKAAKTVGVTELHFLGYPDGRLESSLELRRDISRVIRQVRPERMLCPSPERNLTRIYASHPDHLAAGEAAVCAVYPDARNPWAHPELLQDEGLEPHTVPELWLMAVEPRRPLRRHHRADRAQDRRAAVSREPDARPGPHPEAHHRLGRHDRGDGRPPRRQLRRRLPAHRDHVAERHPKIIDSSSWPLFCVEQRQAGGEEARRLRHRRDSRAAERTSVLDGRHVMPDHHPHEPVPVLRHPAGRRSEPEYDVRTISYVATR